MTEVTEQLQQEKSKQEPKTCRPRGGVWFGATVLLIIALVAGAGFYLFIQLRDRQEGLGGEVKQQMSKQLADYQSQLAAIQNQIASLEGRVNNEDNRFNQALVDFSHSHDDKLDNTRKEFNEAIVHIQRQLGKTRGDWLVADAEYLLSVANERLHLIGDVNTTREALEAADQRLRESGDVGVIKVREQIASELSLLRQVSAPDVIGIYASLQGLESAVDKLVLLLPYADKPLLEPDKNTKDTSDVLGSTLEGLEDLVIIRHSDQAIKEILTPEQAEFIRDQMRVKLEIIKVALVERNEVIFHSSLDDAKRWLEQNFRPTQERQAMMDEIARLKAIKIHSQFPDVSLSYKMLRDIGKLRLETDKSIETTEPNSSHPASVSPTEPVPSHSSEAGQNN